MNIAVVSDYLYPDSVGGSWNYASDVAQRLAARGHRCWGVSAHPGDGRPMAEQVGGIAFRRYPLHHGNHLRSFLSRIAGSLRTMQRLAREHPIDILHTHAPMGSIGALLAPSARPLARLATVHGTGVLPEYLCELAPLANDGAGGGRQRALYCATIDRVERWYLRMTRRASALSCFSRDAFVAQHRLDPASFTVIPPGADLERFRPGCQMTARRTLGLPEARPILLTVRRLTARMGLDLLLRATKALVADHPDLLLLIGGKGPMGPRLAALVAELKLERHVSLLGFIPDEQLTRYYQAADLYVLPSIASEGFGISTLEALTCDLPVLGTPLGGTVELLNAVDPELLFPDTSPGTMAAHISTWLDRVESDRPSYRTRVEEQFNWEANLARMEALFDEARRR